MQRVIISLVLIGFGALSAIAVWREGLTEIFAAALKSFASAQIFFDLVIALTLVMVWMWKDARATGRNPWPWIAATLLTGSFAPLVYLLTRKAGSAS
ncbi:MAG: DUF2834 domain-containing protein [Burkholderiales bacterium]|nr:DUF2834 domain-containing protein [Burkholderiales bacterium]